MDKLKELFVILKELVTGKFYGTIIIKFQEGDIVHCEMRKGLKL
jgi:hypothetical protein